MASLWFAVGSLAAFLFASALSVALQGGAFQVLAVLSLVATLLAVAGFAGAGALARHFPTRRISLLLGMAAAVLFILALWIASLAGADPRASWALVLLPPLLGAAAPWLSRWMRPRTP